MKKSLTFLFDLMSLPRIVQIYFLVILFLISLIILAADYFLSNFIDFSEIFKIPQIEKGGQNKDILNKDILNKDILNKDIQNEDIQNEDIQNKDIQNKDIQKIDDNNLHRHMMPKPNKKLIEASELMKKRGSFPPKK